MSKEQKPLDKYAENNIGQPVSEGEPIKWGPFTTTKEYRTAVHVVVRLPLWVTLFVLALAVGLAWLALSLALVVGWFLGMLLPMLVLYFPTLGHSLRVWWTIQCWLEHNSAWHLDDLTWVDTMGKWFEWVA